MENDGDEVSGRTGHRGGTAGNRRDRHLILCGENVRQRHPHQPAIHTRPEVAIKSFPNLVKLPAGRTGGLLVNLNDEPHASPDIPRANVQVEY
ncbi:MAG: hypothetical protein U1U88_001878 [Lawsonella clevelandensis]